MARPWSTKDYLWSYGGFLLLVAICLVFQALSAVGHEGARYAAGIFNGAALMHSLARIDATRRGWIDESSASGSAPKADAAKDGGR